MILALALAATPLAVSAQSAAGTVDASATILAYLNVQNVADLDFGNIAAGSGATLTPGLVPASGTLGVLQIDHNSEVNVSVSAPAALTLGLNSVPVTFDCGYSLAPSGVLVSAAQSCSAMSNRTATVNGTTQTTYIQVGGDILAANTLNKAPGTYIGSLVFTVTAIY